MLLPVLLGLLLPLLPCVAAGCCWCDPATPDSARTFLSGVDNQSHALVFSDEFDSSSRNFSNGRDTKWTALSVGDTSNKGQAFYLPEQAAVVLDPRTNDSALRILTERRPRTGPGPDGEVGISMPAVSAMLQTWNKFCFTGGVLEFRARMPGGAGYWPALWTFGNLGRAIYQDSNTGLWPWSFDECDGELALHAGAPPQKISACNDHSLLREGLHGFQGRGATELDVVEAAVTNSGGGYAVGSLQLSPAIPNSFRPSWWQGGYPVPGHGAGSWYRDLRYGPTGVVNNGWYGPPPDVDCPTGCPDALSAGISNVDQLAGRYWSYRMEWRPGPRGHIAWFYDDVFIWSIAASSLGEYSSCDPANFGGRDGGCQRTPPRMIPNEPMSLVMNTAIGTWNGGLPATDAKHWPAAMYVDYVRVWQHETNVGCDPPDYPTKRYIEANAELFGEAAHPLGDKTCPGEYPPSAHANAERLKRHTDERRADKRRAEEAAGRSSAKTGGTPGLAGPSSMPRSTILDSAPARTAPSPTERETSQHALSFHILSSHPLHAAMVGGLLLAAVGGVVWLSSWLHVQLEDPEPHRRDYQAMREESMRAAK